MKKATIKSSLIAIASTIAAMGGVASAQDSWIENWKTFAAESGKPEHAAWAARIDTDEVRLLSAEWEEYRGYTASSLIAEATDIPDQLKTPGFVINAENVDSIPGIENYLPSYSIDRLKSDEPWLKIQGIRIVPSNHYYMQKARLDATKAKPTGSFSVDELGNVRDNEGGLGTLTGGGALPFISPKNGDELNATFVAHGVGLDDLFFNPVTMTACGASNNVERSYGVELWWRRMAGRVGSEPFGNVDGFEGVQEAGALLIKSPRDVRGLAGVRLRYADAEIEDDFKLYIPTLRRTRQLSGTNGQDPIAAGLEVTWDDWRGYWTKTDKRNFDYNLVSEGFVLALPEVGAEYDPLAMAENACGIASSNDGIIDMELRPIWVLEIDDKTGNYQYSKRRVYLDKELYYVQFEEMYDRNGELWRVWDDSRWWEPESGRAQWRSLVVGNVISNRHSGLVFEPDWGDGRANMNNSLFDIDQLRDRR